MPCFTSRTTCIRKLCTLQAVWSRSNIKSMSVGMWTVAEMEPFSWRTSVSWTFVLMTRGGIEHCYYSMTIQLLKYNLTSLYTDIIRVYSWSRYLLRICYTLTSNKTNITKILICIVLLEFICSLKKTPNYIILFCNCDTHFSFTLKS